MSKTCQTDQSRNLPAEEWPLEIRCVFEALGRVKQMPRERRSRPRVDHRVQARLWIPSGKKSVPVVVYLRDYAARAVSFVTEVLLPQDLVVELEMLLTDGTPRRVRCKVGRCRQFTDGWFEGVLLSVK